MVRGDRDVAGAHQAHAAGEGVPVYPGDRRLRRLLEGLEELDDRVLGVRRVDLEGRVARVRGEVTARAEGLVAGSGHHEDTDVGIGLAASEGLGEQPGDLVVQRVPLRLAVQGDRLDVFPDVYEHEVGGGGHAGGSPGRQPGPGRDERAGPGRLDQY